LRDGTFIDARALDAERRAKAGIDATKTVMKLMRGLIGGVVDEETVLRDLRE
jgi:hypothetical protein